MELKCKKCGYGWDYMGKSTHYASCARCRTSIDVRKLMETQNSTRMECRHEKQQWRKIVINIYELICSKCWDTIKPEKIMIVGLGIVKKEDILDIEICPNKRT